MANYYNLEALKSIPIQEVAQMLGIEVVTQGGGLWCKIRSEKTASCKLYTSTNTFCDFGSPDAAGDTIDLVACCRQVSNEEAMDILAEMFGIQPLNHDKSSMQDIVRDITYREYALIGIQGELATMNFDIDIEKYGEEKTKRFTDKYRMTVNELRQQYPRVYENMIKIRAIPYVYQQRQDYYAMLWSGDNLSRSLGLDLKQDVKATGEYRQMANRLNAADSILRRAILGTTLKYTSVILSVMTDIEKIRSGAISFEIGNTPYFDLKKREAEQGRKLAFVEVAAEAFINERDKVLAYTVAAFVKGGRVNIACAQSDRESIRKLFFGENRTQEQGVQLESQKVR